MAIRLDPAKARDIAITLKAPAKAIVSHSPGSTEILFAIGAGLTALAGAILAPLNTLDPQYGLLFLVNAFLVVILGGQGSLRGLVVAAVILGGSLSVMQFTISSPPGTSIGPFSTWPPLAFTRATASCTFGTLK